MSDSRSINALLRRGLPSNLARSLVEQGQTITKLKQISKHSLISMGIDEFSADKILDESRPPIPAETLNKLLYESRFAC